MRRKRCAQPAVSGHVAVHGEAVEVDVLDEAGLLDLRLVTRRVPGHQQHRPPEALDQQTALLVRGEGLRAAQGLVAQAPHVPGGGIEQGGRGLLVIKHVEGAEPADALVMKLVVAVIDEGGDGAHRLRAAPGDVVVALHILPGGVLLLVEQLVPHREHGRHPLRTVAVHAPGELEEGAQVSIARHLAHRQRVRHVRLPQACCGKPNCRGRECKPCLTVQCATAILPGVFHSSSMAEQPAVNR